MKHNHSLCIGKLMAALFCALFFAVITAPNENVFAENTAPEGKVTNIQQTEASDSSFRLAWTGVLDPSASYEVRISLDKLNWQVATKYAGSTGTSVFSLPAKGTDYYVQVVPYNGTKYGTPSDIFVAVTAPDNPSEVLTHTGSTTTSISASWTAVPGAVQYRVEYYNTKNYSAISSVITSVPSVTLKNLAKNSKYCINKICACRKSPSGFTAESRGAYMTGSYSGHKNNLPVVPSKVSAPTFQQNDYTNIGVVYMNPVTIDCADGIEYEVYTAPKNNKKAKKIFTSTTSRLDNNFFKKYSAFKVRVRGYIMINAKKRINGAWSAWSYASHPTKFITCKRVSKKKTIKLSWESISGADRYVVKLSTKPKTGYKNAVTSKKTSAKLTKIGKQKISKKKKYYVMIIAQKKVGKKYLPLSSVVTFAKF